METTLKLYNTLDNKISPFVPNEPGKVRMYTCGPTVYHFAHIGNLRSYIMEDVLEKFLRYIGYDVDRVMNNVWNGMGLVCLHSAHMSKVFRRLNGTSGKLIWREANERERIWCANPGHPIAQGLPESFVLDYEEMYGEPFMVAPDAQPVFISWFEGGNVFRSGVTLQRGNGRIFYFRPGHETFPTYYNQNVLKVISNGVRWCAPTVRFPYPTTHRPNADEQISPKVRQTSPEA